MANYIDLSTLPISPSEQLKSVVGLDENNDIITVKFSVDSELSTTSENPVQNKVIASAIDSINSTIGDINNILTEING